MLVQCTKKLRDKLKIKPGTRVEEDSIYSWHANVITIDRRQAVVLMNDKTRYVIVLYGLRAKDFSKINKWIPHAIREVFLHEGIKEEVIDRYLQDAGEMTFTKTKDPTQVARLNMAVSNTEHFSYGIELMEGVNKELSAKVSRLLASEARQGYIMPNEEMFQELKARYGNTIFRTKAAEMKVTLLLQDEEVTRTLIVPLNRTFSEFHEILQTAFSWMDYHLHEFYLLDKNTAGKELPWRYSTYSLEGYKPVLNLVSDNEFESTSNIEVKTDIGVQLSTYIPAYNMLTYHYDFGDNWLHQIEVTRIIDDYDTHHPVCTDGIGTAPPEDVGGEGGYREFLKITENPNDPDYHHMRQWAITQGYRDFDKSEINARLKGQ